MGTYKEIRGTHIVSVTSDPPSPVNGQMWYNSTDKVIKGFTSNPAGTWATSTALNNARGAGSTAGTNASAWFVGGEDPGGYENKTELWNGSSWTNSATTSRPGAYTCAQSMAVPNNSTGLLFGGHYGTDPAAQFALCEDWNGSAWTEVADLNTARYGRAGFGSYTSALYAGSSPSNNVETWNGSSWTEVADQNNTGKDGGAGVVNTAGLSYGGFPTGHTEIWNGSSWTETGNLNVARYSCAGAGASSGAAIATGGQAPPASPSYVGSVEEFSSPTTSTVTFTVS